MPAALLSLLFMTTALHVPIERYVLPNGLVVILHEDHRLPNVVVDLTFRVGSKDEKPGRTGFAHLFEHLMFMGTKNVPNGRFDAILEGAGGYDNASTDEDYTNYFDSGPSNLLETFLWLEADRLSSLPDDMTKAKVDLQRDVVKNERREVYENRPYGRAELALPDKLYPPGHPYHHPVIGSHADLERRQRRRRQGVLPRVLRAVERVARHQRRLLAGGRPAAGRQVLRVDAQAPGASCTRRPRRSRWRRRRACSSPTPCSCRAWCWRGTRRADSSTGTPSATCSRRCSAAATRRGCISGWSTSRSWPSRSRSSSAPRATARSWWWWRQRSRATRRRSWSGPSTPSWGASTRRRRPSASSTRARAFVQTDLLHEIESPVQLAAALNRFEVRFGDAVAAAEALPRALRRA